MKILNLALCVVLLLFAVAQYNDPDSLLWMAIYAIPAVWAGIAAFRPSWLRLGAAAGLYGLCLLAALAATLYYWPTTPDWWKTSVWWEEETAREGMGAMVVLFALLVVGYTAWRARRRV